MSIICMKHCLQLLQRSADSFNLLQVFSQRDDALRHEAVSTIQRVFDSWYFGFGSPALAGFLESVVKDTGGATLDTSMHGLIMEQIPDLLRIYYTGPLEDIRSSANDLLIDLKTKKCFHIPRVLSLSPSYVLSLDEMDHMRCLSSTVTESDAFYTTYILFREYWFQWGSLYNYICVMGYHPEYLECYMKLQDHLFHGDLPLPYPDRYYLAVMAAAEQRCIYLVLLFARQFISSGGPPSWLQGIQYGPSKWRQLCKLNRDLANQPWEICSHDIYYLTHGDELGSLKETISLSELMHAVAIFTQVHALVSFVYGCAIRPEIDQHDGLLGLYANNNEPEEVLLKSKINDSSVIANENCECIFQPLNTIENGNSDSPNNTHGDNLFSQFTLCASIGNNNSDNTSGCDGDQYSYKQEGTPTSKLLKIIQTEDSEWTEVAEDIAAEQFIAATRMNAKLTDDYLLCSSIGTYLNKLNKHPLIIRFTESIESKCQNFAGRPFHVSEYSWPEEGSSLADRLCTNLGTLLDEKFRNAYDLTYNTLNYFTNVNTTLYRRTVWNQIQSFFGICHDDFRYDRTTHLLSSKQCAFLKLIATCPASIGLMEMRVFKQIFPALSPSEVIHVILMVIEAKQQACLLYVLRAISECQART